MVDLSGSEWSYWFGHSVQGRGVGISDMVNVSGASSGTVHDDGVYQKLTSGSTAGNGATSLSMNTTPSDTANNVFFDQDFDISLVIRTVEVTQVRVWLALLDQNSTMGNNSSFPGSANVIGIRYDGSGSAGSWIGFSQDGASSTDTSLGGTVSGSTKYLLRIRKSGGTVYFSVDGGTEVSTSSHVPTANAAAQLSLEVWTIVNGSPRNFEVGRIGCLIGS
jgi:hypothetical protein